MSGEGGPEARNQLRVHESVVVGNAQRDHLLAGHFLGKAAVEQLGVLAFHAKDQVGPAEMAGGYLDPCAVGCAGAPGIIARMMFEERFRGRAAPLIARADEKKLGFQV